jgi:predicted nuclease of predicted toxin-antitoxin system
VKLLFDQNLSHRLPTLLADLFPDSAHVRAATLDQAPDDQIWEYVSANEFCIVTQDSDFAERSRLYGAPPKVVWLRCGNSPPQEVELTAMTALGPGLAVGLAVAHLSHWPNKRP